MGSEDEVFSRMLLIQSNKTREQQHLEVYKPSYAGMSSSNFVFLHPGEPVSPPFDPICQLASQDALDCLPSTYIL